MLVLLLRLNVCALTIGDEIGIGVKDGDGEESASKYGCMVGITAAAPSLGSSKSGALQLYMVNNRIEHTTTIKIRIIYLELAMQLSQIYIVSLKERKRTGFIALLCFRALVKSSYLDFTASFTAL